MEKKLWKGIFMYQCEMERAYVYAHTERQAWLVFCRRLAKKHGVEPRVVMGLFDGSKNNYSIEQEFRPKSEITE